MKNKTVKTHGEFLGDVNDMKAYFSNKDEIMAFAQSLSDIAMSGKPKNIKEAIKGIKEHPLWLHIEKNINDKTKKRYLKYLYLYIEREFDKKEKK